MKNTATWITKNVAGLVMISLVKWHSCLPEFIANMFILMALKQVNVHTKMARKRFIFGPTSKNH